MIASHYAMHSSSCFVSRRTVHAAAMSGLIFSLLVAGISHLVLAQPLKADQYAALMNVYSGLGESFSLSMHLGVLWVLTKFFAFFSARQDAMRLCAHVSTRHRIAPDGCLVVTAMSSDCAFLCSRGLLSQQEVLHPGFTGS